MNSELVHLIESNGLTLHGDIEYFAHLVAEAAAAKEREACAMVCDKYGKANEESDVMAEALAHCAAAIRARGQE